MVDALEAVLNLFLTGASRGSILFNGEFVVDATLRPFGAGSCSQINQNVIPSAAAATSRRSLLGVR